MKRTIINIDEEKCNGCSVCIEGCMEGALQMIDGKARMVSELFCDGLGACIGECPEGAITLEEREAQPYDEIAVLMRFSKMGNNTILAHLRHLKEHNEEKYLSIAFDYIKENNIDMDITQFKQTQNFEIMNSNSGFSSCPGSKTMEFNKNQVQKEVTITDTPSELSHWPIQLHLVNPGAAYYQNADVVLAADCVAFSMGNFHSKFLKGKSLAIACPKLDSNMEVYVNKLTTMIDTSQINTLTVIIMEVPCCGGLLKLSQLALQNATRKIPIKLVVISVEGNIKSENWV